MALNYSHRPIFPAHTAEDNLVSPMRIVNGYLVEGVPERNMEGCARPRYVGVEMDESFDYGRDRARADRCGSPESVSRDVVDLLPSDPFGMDISTTVTAITGWLEDLEQEYRVFGRSYMEGTYNEEYDLFADLNMIWNSAMKFQSFSGNVQVDEKSKIDIEGHRHAEKRDYGNPITRSACNEGDITGSNCATTISDVLRFEKVRFNNVNTSADALQLEKKGLNSMRMRVDDLRVEEKAEVLKSCPGGDEGPHEALDFALRFLGVKDLLSIRRVCRHLYNKVHSDNLLWRSIHIDQPLNERINDDILLKLTSRAEGTLECLSLVECPRITDDGLRRVLESNPQLTKLCVPGCTRLSIAGLVNIVKAFNSKEGTLGIKHLRIGGLYGITYEHFEELISLLGAKDSIQQSSRKLRFYHCGDFYPLCDDDRAIDVETCPRCEKLRLVYDCPPEGCQMKDQTSLRCRACSICIPRCVQCGRCINDNEYEETFCLELLCADCFKQLPKFQDNSVNPRVYFSRAHL